MKKAKRILVLFMACLTMMLAMVGCATDNGGEGGSEVEAEDMGLLKSGELKVAMEIGYPPFEFYADDGVTELGFDVDMAKAIGEIMGVDVVFENTVFDGIEDGLATDRYDCVISAFTITGARMEKVDFSHAYIENWQSIVIKRGGTPVTSVEELNGLNVGFQEGTTSREYIDELMADGTVDCTVHPFDSMVNAFDDLKLGRLDAVLVDSTVAEGYLAREEESYEMSWIQSDDENAEPELFAIAVKKGNEELLKAINAAMKILEENRTMENLRFEWLA